MSSRAIRTLSGKVAQLRTLGAKVLLQRLITLHREDEPLQCVIKQFARLVGVKPETVRNALQELERAGVVAVIDGLVILRMDEPIPANQVGEIIPVEVAQVSPQSEVQGPASGPGGGRPVAPKGAGQRPPFQKEDQKHARANAREEIGYLPPGRGRTDRDFLEAMRRAGFTPEASELGLRTARSELTAVEASGLLPGWLVKCSEVERLVWAWRRLQRGELAG